LRLRRNRKILASITSRCNYIEKSLQDAIAIARLARDCVLQSRLVIAIASRTRASAQTRLCLARLCCTRTSAATALNRARRSLVCALSCAQHAIAIARRNRTTQARDTIAFARHVRVSAHSLARASLTVNNNLPHTATHCNTLQHTATHCNTHTNVRVSAHSLARASFTVNNNLPHTQCVAATHSVCSQHTLSVFSVCVLQTHTQCVDTQCVCCSLSVCVAVSVCVLQSQCVRCSFSVCVAVSVCALQSLCVCCSLSVCVAVSVCALQSQCVRCSLSVCVAVSVCVTPAQGWRNRTLISRQRVDSPFLVLPGSDSIFTEITKYVYFSLIMTRVEFEYISDLNIVPSVLIDGLIPFLRSTLYYIPAARGRSECDFSILVRSVCVLQCVATL